MFRLILRSLGFLRPQFGGGGGGQQTVTNEFKPPEYTKEGWQQYIQNGMGLANIPYQQSGIPTVAPINDFVQTGNQLAYDLALYGTPMSNASSGAAMQAAMGNYANPMTQNVLGIASGQAYNPALEGYYNLANMGPNPYTSPEYVNDKIARQAQMMAQGHASGTAAQNDAAAAMAGAYGGTGHQQKQAADAAALAQQIGNMASGELTAQQQYAGNMYNQDFANRMSALGGYSNAYMGDVGNQLAANAQASGNWQQDIGNILSGAALGYQGNQDYRNNLSGLMQAGQNYTNYEQRLYDALNQQWNTQNQYDFNMNEYLGSVLGRASGSYGTTASTQPGQSPLAGLLGLGMTGAGMYSLYSGK